MKFTLVTSNLGILVAGEGADDKGDGTVDHEDCYVDIRDTAKDAPVNDHVDCCEDTGDTGDNIDTRDNRDTASAKDAPVYDHVDCCEDTRDNRDTRDNGDTRDNRDTASAKGAPVNDHVDCCEDTCQPGARQGPAGAEQLYCQLHCNALHCIVLHCTQLHHIPLHRIPLHFTSRHHNALHLPALHPNASHPVLVDSKCWSVNIAQTAVKALRPQLGKRLEDLFAQLMHCVAPPAGRPVTPDKVQGTEEDSLEEEDGVGVEKYGGQTEGVELEERGQQDLLVNVEPGAECLTLATTQPPTCAGC